METKNANKQWIDNFPKELASQRDPKDMRPFPRWISPYGWAKDGTLVKRDPDNA